MNTRYAHLMNNAHLARLADGAKGELQVTSKVIKLVGGVDAMTRRIVSLWLLMFDVYRTMGRSWYPEANEFASFLANTYELTLWQSSQVIAVLSPQNPWQGRYSKNGIRMGDGNRLCAVRVIDSFYHGGQEAVMSLRGWGYAPEFLKKAIRVMMGEEIDWNSAPKTYRFACLIFNPLRRDIAVIDSHASRIATGNVGGRYHIVSKSAYPFIEQAYLNAGIILNEAASDVQGGTWVLASEGELYEKE